MDLKAISCRIEWSLFQVHSPKYMCYNFLCSQSHYSGSSASKVNDAVLNTNIPQMSLVCRSRKVQLSLNS